MNQEQDFELLLKLKELEKETNFKIEQDKNNKNLFYLTEPNATIPFATIDYNKESENGENARDTRTNSKTSTLRECSAIFLERVRGIIGKRIARSKEREDRSQAEISRSSEIQTGSGSICEGRESICGINGKEIWRRDFDARISFQALQQRNQKLEETNRLIQQSEYYKQQALKAYQQNGVTLTPNIKNLQNKNASNTESPQKEISPPDYEEILNADKGFRTEKTIQYTIEQIAKEYHLPIEQVKMEIDRILYKQEKENPKTQESIQSKTQNQEVNKAQDKVLLPKRESKTLENP